MRRSVLAAGLLVLVACASGAGDVSGLPVLSETGAQVDGANVRLVANVDSESAPLRVTVDWGDGTTDVLSDVAPGAISARHVYVSAGDFTIGLEAATPEGGTQVATVEVTIEESAIAAPATTSPTPTSTTETTTTETTPSTEATTTTEATATTTTQATTTSSAPVTGGDLLYYRHPANPTGEGQFEVTGLKVGDGWAKFKTVISGGHDRSFNDVVLYAITEDGDLLYYRHREDPTGERQFEAAGVKIGAGWDQFKTVTAGGNGILYAVTEDGDLLYYRHREDPTGERQFEVTGLKIGAGWDQFETVIGGVLRCKPRPGVLYAITEGGDLLYYRHPANVTGEGQFEVTGLKIGAGWDRFETVLSGGLACALLGPHGPGVLYAITEGGDLLYYRHPANVTGEGQFEVTGLKIGAGWDQFRTVTSGPLHSGNIRSHGVLYAVTEP